ncbi:hypothetical protein VULLAG_LOCUS12340 [Vulpes lagopus]
MGTPRLWSAWTSVRHQASCPMSPVPPRVTVARQRVLDCPGAVLPRQPHPQSPIHPGDQAGAHRLRGRSEDKSPSGPSVNRRVGVASLCKGDRWTAQLEDLWWPPARSLEPGVKQAEVSKTHAPGSLLIGTGGHKLHSLSQRINI